MQKKFPHVPRIALTASADMRTRTEIIEKLDLYKARIFISSFDRPNIRYQIKPKKNSKEQLLRYLREHHAGDAGIASNVANQPNPRHSKDQDPDSEVPDAAASRR